MRKSSKLAIFMALLLSSTTVFAACGDSFDGDSSGSGTGYVSPSVEEEQMNKIYKERLDSWMKYIDYEAPETVANAALDLTAPLTAEETDAKKLTLSNNSKVLIVKERDETKKTKTVTYTRNKPNPNYGQPDEPQFLPNPNYGEPGEPEYVQEEYDVEEYDYSVFKTKISVQSIETGETIWSESQRETKSGTYASGTEFVKERPSNVVYTIDEDWHTSFFEVAKTTWTMNPPEEGVEENDTYKNNPANYTAKTTYSYYNSTTGDALAENTVDLSEPLTLRGNYLDTADKTYLLGEDGIVKTFALGMEYNLPSFTSSTRYGLSDYIEQGEYGYHISEKQFVVTAQSGDLLGGYWPEVSVDVYKENELVATYTTDCYNVGGYGILSNGNVYFSEWRLINDETKADFKRENYNIDVVHTVLDVTTGATKEVNNAFTVQRVYTNVTGEIKTLHNANTTLLVNGNVDNPNNHMNLHLKDGYLLAEIQKFENGALQGNSSYAVLNASTLELVEELPKLVDSQFGYAGYISESEVLFAVKTLDDQILRYTVNTETGDMELFKKSSAGIEFLTADTFIYDKTIYDYEWNEIADLTEYDGYTVLGNGKLLLKTSSETYNYYSIGSLESSRNNYNEYKDDTSKSSYVLSKQELRTNGYSSFGSWNVSTIEHGYFTLAKDSYLVYFDLSGNQLFTTEQTTEYKYIHEEAIDSYKYVYYKVTTSYSVYATLEDGSAIVKKSISWTETNRYGYDYLEEPTNDMNGKTYNQYFILK